MKKLEKKWIYLFSCIILITISMFMIPTFENALQLLGALAIGSVIGIIQGKSK